MQKWEYKTSAIAVTDLPAMGQLGWRMVAIDGGLMFFERPLEKRTYRLNVDAAKTSVQRAPAAPQFTYTA
jgi:hypothetical protein